MYSSITEINHSLFANSMMNTNLIGMMCMKNDISIYQIMLSILLMNCIILKTYLEIKMM